MKQLESGYKRTIYWNKYHPENKTCPQNKYLNYSIDPNFQGVNRLFVLPFKNKTDREVHTKYYLPTEEIKDDNVIIDGRYVFDQPIKNDFITYDNIILQHFIATGERGDYTTGWLLGYNYFKKDFKIIAVELGKQQNIDADPKAIQQINFTGTIEKDTSILSIIEEAKERYLDFSKSDFIQF